jgi:nitrilase
MVEKKNKKIRVAAIQAAPVYLDIKASVDKACYLIEDAAKNGARMVLFPEVFLSGYPDWVWIVPNGKGTILNALYEELWENAVSIPDLSTEQLSRTAKKYGIMVAIGMHEKNTEKSGGSLYNSLLFIDEEGEILGVHRKLIPTGGERTVWSRGNGNSLRVYNTRIAKIGGLICWENFLPLARQTLYDQGIQIHLAPTWDKSSNWIQSMQHIAREGGMAVISCCQAFRMKDIPDHLEFKSFYPDNREWINAGNSCIIDANGNFLAEPIENRETIIYADIDLNVNLHSKRMFDVAGHYSRPDVFRLSVNEKPKNRTTTNDWPQS